MHRASVLLAILLLSTAVSAAPADDIFEAFQAMARGDGIEAAAILGRLAGGRDPLSIQATLVRGRALLQAGRLDAAAEVFESLVRRLDPKDPAGRKARFGLADCQARRGRFEQAEKLFAEALAELTSPARREAIADRFLRLAEEQLQPLEAGVSPNPAAAENLFRAALEVGLEGEQRERTEWKVIECLVAQKSHANAVAALEAFLRDHEDSARRAEATALAGEQALEARQFAVARRHLANLLADWPQAPQAAKAAYLMARTWGLPEPPDGPSLLRGQAALRRYLRQFPKDERAEDARLELALAPMHLKRHAEAEAELRALLQAGGPEDTMASARYHLGLCLAGQGRWADAAQAYRDYLKQHPAHAYWAQARAGIEEARWQEAEVAMAEEHWTDAAARFLAFAEEHAANPRAPEALLRAAAAHLAPCRLAGHPAPSPTSVADQKRCETGKPADAALEVLALLTAKFPSSPAGWRGWLEKGRVLEEYKSDMAGARAAYEKAKAAGSPVAGEASGHLALLETPSLVIESPDNARSGQRPQLRWHVRNIESVEVRSFRLNAEDYFRDRQQIEDVTEVDIALCSPDRTLNIPVEGYRRHVPIVQQVELPLERPGLYVLSLSAGKLSATTAVLVSDLELIVKSGPGWLFVLAFDAQAMRPRSGVRVLVGNGQKLLFEATTGTDGTLYQSLPSDIEAEELRVFAADGEHLAWTGAQAGSGQVAKAFSPRAFLMSDRPAYRPGDRVRLAGILRAAEDKGYRPPAGKPVTVEVSDPAGRPVERLSAVADDFGVFAVEMRLDPQAEPGGYSFSVSCEDVGSHSGSFLVQQSRRPPFDLSIDFERPVVLRGQPLTGHISVRHPGGAPAVEQPVQYRLRPLGDWQDAVTDDTGLVRFSFPTRAAEETAELTLEVLLPQGRQRGEAKALVAVAGFELELRAGERTAFAGQPFAVTLEASDFRGRPRALKAQVMAVRRDARGGGELLVDRREVTLPDSGRAVVELTLPEGGFHLLRAFAVDDAGEPITAEIGLQVTGPKEPGLFLDVADAPLVVGGQAEVTIHSRLERALVLVTCETDDLLCHRTLLVRRGANPLSLPISEALAPNFGLAVTAVDGDQLHQVQRNLAVHRGLKLELRSDREQAAPGDEVTLTVVARDAAGRPADARLLLTVVDEALLKTFPENLPTLLSVFHLQRAIGGVATAASMHRFPQVTAEEVVQAEVHEATGSAALAALSDRRRAETARARGEFDSLVGNEVGSGEAYGVGGLGMRGHGAGGAGAGYGSAAIRMGKAQVMGRGADAWRQFFEETAAFSHELQTGPDGVASFRFRLPDSVTRWRVTGRAVTRDTSVGEARIEVVTQQAFFARLLVPPEVEAGDRIRPVARVLNDTDRALEARVRLRVGEQEQLGKVLLPARRSADVSFEELALPATAGSEITFELEAEAGELRDRLRLRLPVVPAGMRERVLTGGLLEGRAVAELMAEKDWSGTGLRLRLSPRPLLFFVGGGFDPLFFGDRPEAALVALETLDLLGPTAEPSMRELVQARLARSINHLLAAQRSDGAWAWSREAPSASLEITAAAVRALARARARLDAGLVQAALDRGTAWLTEQLTSLPPDAFGQRAEALFAVAHLGLERVPFVQLNRLHRLRGELDTGAAALLGLTWTALGRPEQANEVVQTLRSKLAFDANRPALNWDMALGWGGVDRVRALQLLSTVAPSDPLVLQGRRWLLEHGRSFGWFCPRLAEASLSALGRLAAAEARSVRLRVAVTLNGKSAATLEIRGDAPASELELDPALLQPGANRLELVSEGAGQCLWTAELSGQRLTAPAPAPDAPLRLRRVLELAPEPYRGVPITAGFGVVTPPIERWLNEISSLPAGRDVQVTLMLERNSHRTLDSFVVEERIPPGFELVPNSLGGNFSHVKRDGRRLAFFLTGAPTRMDLTYRLSAVHPGAFHFAPVQLLSLADPDLHLLGPGSDLAIAIAGGPAPATRMTPDELYQRGRVAADKKDPAAVLEHLEPLWDGFRLRADKVNEVLSLLLFAAIERDDDERILKYFELAKEKNPELVIPFDRIAPVQRAYRALRSFEGGLYLDRGLADAQFLREMRAIGVLEGQDEMAEAMDLLRDQLGGFPESQQTARATYAFSQVMFGRADRLAAGEPLRGFDRPGLLSEVTAFMARFLGLYPDDPDAPQAFYSLATALVELDRPQQAIAWCRAGLARHGESEEAPALTYLQAFAHFRLGQWTDSLELLDRVIARDDQDEHRDMALYIAAQIHQARGDLARALAGYRQVRERFRDADETVRELEAEQFKVEEVVEARGGGATLEVTAKNVPAVEVRAYKVDLMKLYQLKGSLRDLAEVNLAGIKPIFSRRFRLDPRNRSAPVVEPLRLPLPGRGAYLVLARGGSITRHSLVLLDALQLEVTELVAEGRVRVGVRDARGRSVTDARVQLKGEENDSFTAGKTDLRGIFIADGLNGAVAVIAERAGAWGLYRGQNPLQGDAGGENAEETVQYRKKTQYDFGDDMIEGQLNKPDGEYLMQRRASPAANEFFKQEVKGMSVQQAK